MEDKNERNTYKFCAEQSAALYERMSDYGELSAFLESEKLMRAISGLKEREKRILFARVFGEMSFTEIGLEFGMEPKQAEMAYYYVIRKLRNRLGVMPDEL